MPRCVGQRNLEISLDVVPWCTARVIDGLAE